MDWQFLVDWWDSQTPLGIDVGQIISIAIIALIALILERAITRHLKKFARKAHLAPHVTNTVALTFRILILIGAAVSVGKASGLTTEWFLALSALGGAAVGFASSQTIGNFIAGLYLLSARPFKVGDYVRIGTVEGIVQEINISYTKILTAGNNVALIINLQILNRDVINYLYETDEHGTLYCYTFEIGFDHSVSAAKIAQVFNRVFDSHGQELPRKPSYALIRSGAFERVYLIYICVKDPETIFDLRPRIAEEVFRQWDDERAKEKK